MKSYIAAIRSNLRLMGRDRSVLFFSILFPMVFFFTFSFAYHAKENPGVMSQVIAMVMIIGVLGSGFFGAGMRTVTDRETNVLRRFKVAPTNAGPIIVASMVSGLVAYLPTIFLFFFFSKVFFHAPLPSNLLSVVIFVSIGLLTFRAMGMIVAAVVNSAQEATILIQLLYLPMLFLSGATFPVSFMPVWVQSVAQFLPATYLFQGLIRIMVGGESVIANYKSALSLILAMAVALFVGIKLFRWEKEEKISGRAKLWILAVLAPFIISGVYQARTKQNVERAKILERQAYGRGSVLFQNIRIFVGNGTVIPNGAVLIKDGKITQVFGTPPTETKEFDANVVDDAGKTLMPGLIDMHVHLGAPGGVYDAPVKYADPNAEKRRLAAYLYSGITAVRSTGDQLHDSLNLRKEMQSGKYQGADLFTCGPLFTAEGGHPEELIKYFPASMQASAKAEFLRQPKSPAEAQRQVDQLKSAGVDCIKSVLEGGNPEWGTFNRLDNEIYRAVIDESRKDSLPSATHTGNAADVRVAVHAGTNSVEHGSMTDLVPAETFTEMARKQSAYDPTLSVYEALAAVRTGNLELLSRSLVQQVGPADLLTSTRNAFKNPKDRIDPSHFTRMFEILNTNLLNAYKAGVPLITGSDAGNMLVIHGPTIQRELELWVKAGIPPAAALQAATYNAAKVLRTDARFGLIQKDREATLIVVDGDPVQDITAIQHINSVYLRGEHIDRSDLFDQFKP